MTDHVKIAKELELKQKSLPKTEEAFNNASEDLKKAEADRDKTEKGLKAEKDLKKKKKLEDSLVEFKQQVETLTKKRDNLEKALDELNKSISRLKGEAIKAFGESRAEFVEWFKGEQAKVDKIIDQAKRIHDGVIKEVKKTGDLVSSGEPVKAAEAAGTAGKLVEFAQAEMKKFDELYRAWGTKFGEQRNLAPKEFGLLTADVQVHKAVTSKVYAVFNAADKARDELSDVIEKASTMSDEAEMILQAGGANLAAYEKMLEKSALMIAAKIKDYNNEFEKSWARMIRDSGSRFDEEIERIKGKDQGLIQRALKVYEQGSSALPKAYEGLESLVKQINQLATKERSRIPEQFQRPLKSKLDEISQQVMSLVREHATVKPKYEKTMEKLEQLGKAAGA